VTGAVREAGSYIIANSRTALPLRLPPYGSVFVVFRPRALATPTAGKYFELLKPFQELTGPWTVRFDPKWGGPASARFDQLVSWPTRPEDGVKFYSGPAGYCKSFDLDERLRRPGRRIYLDLGAVRDLAEVRLNGMNVGTVWTTPWRVDVTEALRLEGNSLEIAVTNLWPNRLIGDAALPVEKRLTKTNIGFNKDQPLLESGLLGPVRLMARE